MSETTPGHHDHTTFGPQWWEDHYQGHSAGHGAPGAQLVAEVAGLAPGAALDAGCGSGADAIWLARQGWQVTAVDIAPTAVRHAEHQAPGLGVTWLVADLVTWRPPRQYDLVVSQYVHPAVAFDRFAARLAEAVAPGGTLLVVGHDHTDAHSAAHAPQQASIGAGDVTRGLDPDRWDVEVAESRTRHVERGTTRVAMADFVVKARRKPQPAGPAAAIQ